MAPGGGGKRKRGDRTFSHDSGETSRPSPHRPGSLTLAQQSYQYQSPQQYGFQRDQYDQRGRGSRRVSRGGRGGPIRSPLNSPNAIPVQSRQGMSTSNAMSPPAVPTQRPTEAPEIMASQPVAPVTSASTQTPPPDPTPTPSFYAFEVFTDELCSSWQTEGRSTLVESGRLACLERDPFRLGIVFQEIIRSGLDGRIDPSDAGSVVGDILEGQTQEIGATETLELFSGASIFLNCLSVLTESNTNHGSLQPMVLATKISPQLMREELESTLLEHLGLIRNTFVRIGIRRQTNLLYRQSNYNLLREETEGYSKLATELYTTSTREPPSAEVVEDTFERVKAMIGTFDLDVGRVLDVTFDVIAAVLVKQYRFFVKYLRASSWWPQQHSLHNISTPVSVSTGLPRWALPDNTGVDKPTEEEKAETKESRDKRDTEFWERVREIGLKAFFEIGGRRADNIALQIPSRVEDGEEMSQLEEDRQWAKVTGTLPPLGNKVAAQILGFKLRFYSSPARDSNDVLPVNLIYLAALLIKIGFVSLRDLYPHLWPADEDMETVREEKMKEKLEREKLNRPGGGTMNALMTAGALADDTIPGGGRLRETDGNKGPPPKPDSLPEKIVPTVKADPAEELPEPADQKVQLLRSLLCIGAIPESLYILGRFPWLLDAFPDLPEHIHRLLHHSLSKIYEPLRPLPDYSDIREQHKIVDLDQSGVPKGQLRQIDQPDRKTLRWAQLDKNDAKEATDYRFYWDDWNDNVPVCQSVDDVFSLCGTLLNISGVKIGQDPALLAKLARIGTHSLTVDTSEHNKQRWIDLSKRLLVPALSLTKSNDGVVSEIFELIKQFPTTTRYSIYAEWYSGVTSRLPDIKSAFDQVRAETKDVLKRISRTNIKPMARALAKVATASPGVVFSVAMAQIESYDNLVEVVVECARYFTYLGYDVLTWSLMSSLGARGRNRVQADGMLTSKWLGALSLFAGKVFKRYSVMNASPILQYVTEQLRLGNSTDLIVLEEITSSMAGIVSDTNFNEAQVLAMAGGDILQSQTMLQLLDRRHESTGTAKRLMKALVEPKLAGQLMISIAQERQTCVFKIPEEDSHLKLLGNLFDEIHRVLTQYLDLLRSRLSVREFDTLVPGVAQLLGEFGIDPSVAFWISRPSIAAEMKYYDTQASERAAETKESPQRQIAESTNKLDAEMTEAEGETSEPKQVTTPSEDVEAINVDEAEMEASTKDISQPDHVITSPASRLNYINQPWHPVLRHLMGEIRSKVPSQIWEVLSEPFYVTFWQLSLGDMLVPTQSYEDEINRQKKKIVAISSDRSDLSIIGTQKKERDKKSLTDLQEQLRSELKEQITAYQQTRNRLQKEKEHWFADCWGKWDSLNIALLEHCFFPRILISPVDALYAFKMLKLLHSTGANNFRTMGFLDQLLNGKRLIFVFFLCTAKEAENVGRFLNEVLKDLGRWHADKAVFEKEAYGVKRDLPGFCKKMTGDKSVLSFLEYEDFRKILQKWHMNLNLALKACFTGGEYMHIRNAIVVLKAVVMHFPVINWMGQAQVASITELTRTESREDLKIAATSLLGNLRRREKEWVLPQAFALNKPATNGVNGTRSTSAKPTTPQPESESSQTLNARAPEFKPVAPMKVNETPKASLSTFGRLEVEDGEINDITIGITTAKGVNSKAAEASKPTDASSDQPSEQAFVPEKRDAIQKMNEQAPSPNRAEEADVNAKDVTRPKTPQPPGTALKPNGTLPATQPSIPPRPARPEPNRNISAHGLPSRPDGLPGPSRSGEPRFPDRPGDRGLRERDSWYQEHGRMERPNEFIRDRVNDRHLSGSHLRGYDRPPERGPHDDRDRLEPTWGGEKNQPGRLQPSDRHTAPPTRDPRSLSRDERLDRTSRDRPYPEPLDAIRNGEQHGRSSRDHSMGPPRSSVSQHPDQAALIHGPLDGDRDHSSGHSDRRTDSLRHEGHPTSQRNSRASSPSRRDDHRSSRHDHHSREDRQGTESRRGPEDVPSSYPSHYDDSRPPTGPRTDRYGDGQSNAQSERFRDTLRAQALTNQALDPHHGRLNQPSSSSSRYQDPQYGRLNVEVPSGPRMSNGAHGPTPRSSTRNVSAPQPPTVAIASPTSQTAAPSSSVPDRQAPIGPSSNRGPPRVPAPLTQPLTGSTSTPSTPVTEAPDIAAVHPDRLKAIQGASGDLASGSNRASDRPLPPPISTATPAGPRGPNFGQPLSPMGPLRANQGPPTGPSFPSNERSRGDKRFAGIQNVLSQQSSAFHGPDRSSQGASIRGRGGRVNNFGHASSAVTSGPPTPSLPRHDQSSRQDPFPPARADLFANRAASGPSTPHHEEDDLGRSRSGWREGPERGPERRSTGHRESRSHSHDRHPAGSNVPPSGPPPAGRDSDRPPRRGEEALREHRGRGGGGPGAGSGPPPADPGGREQRRGGRDGDMGPTERDRRGESDRREMEEWGGGRGRGDGERGDEWERRDGGRKRGRGGEDPGMGFGDGKRSRRGL